MTKEKQIDSMYEDIVEIFDEEYGKRNLITPQNTAEKMTAKGYRKASDVAREIFEEIEDVLNNIGYFDEIDYNELKKKYTEEGK